MRLFFENLFAKRLEKPKQRSLLANTLPMGDGITTYSEVEIKDARLRGKPRVIILGKVDALNEVG